MAWKDISVSVDVDELEKQIEDNRESDTGSVEENEGVRSTVFSLGKDPRIGVKQGVSVPDFRYIEILKDGLDNPYVELNWRIPRHNIDSAGVIGFNIFRRRVSPQEIEKSSKDVKRYPITFSRGDFDNISKKISRRGKFSAEKKAIYQLKRGAIPKSILNPNLDKQESIERARYDSSIGQTASNARFNSLLREKPSVFQKGTFENLFKDRSFAKIGYVDYTQFLKDESKKFVSVKEREFIDLLFKDKEVGYGQSFEYYVVSITRDSQESVRSEAIKVKIEDMISLRKPTLYVSQVNERAVLLQVHLNYRDNVSKVHVYRKSEIEVEFVKIASARNVNNLIKVQDSTVEYGRRYTYRVFASNMYGTLSEPGQIEYASTVQKITPQSRSNNLRMPILTVVQDQNSDYIKINISPNDSSVAYYQIDRRDLTIHEKKFTAPIRSIYSQPGAHLGDYQYGGKGWESNKFFVKKTRQEISKNSSSYKSTINRKVVGEEIEFIDNTVSPNHIYQYRAVGYDLFGNPTPYNLVMVRVVGKKSVRAPINFRSEVLRGSPIRIKLKWDDDNPSSELSASELFDGKSSTDKNSSKIIYRVQRRKLGENTYETFPLTANNFIIDEEPALDAINLTQDKQDDTYVKVPNVVKDDGSVNVVDSSISRPFGTPDFLRENDTYFYRVASISVSGVESNYTKEFEVSTLPDLSIPTNFKVQVVNTKVRPVIATLTWGVEETKAKADFYTIERKHDVINDVFSLIGRSYIDTEFFDRDIESGNTYIYRIKAIDGLGRESVYVEARLTI